VLARPLGESALDLVECKRVVTQIRRVDEGERGLRRLAVAVDRRRLAPPHLAVALDRDVDDLGDVLRAARDGEDLRERQCDDLARDPHAGTLTRR
jgi:hypothetical protein